MDAEQDERPEQHGESGGHDAVDRLQVVEEVALGGDDAADDDVDEDPEADAHTQDRSGRTVREPDRAPAGERGVSDKSPKKDSGKKEGKSLKEKRSAKKIKQADKATANKNL